MQRLVEQVTFAQQREERLACVTPQRRQRSSGGPSCVLLDLPSPLLLPAAALALLFD